MNRILLILAVLFAGSIFCSAGQYDNIEPELKCHFPQKKRSFCDRRPNFSRRHNICNPPATMLGHIIWKQEEVTLNDNYGPYEAVLITYRKVYENGAWGEKFQRSYRKDPLIITPPVIYK